VGVDHLHRDLPAGDRALERARPGQDRRSRDGKLGDLLGALAQRTVQGVPKLAVDQRHGGRAEQCDRGQDRHRRRRDQSRPERSGHRNQAAAHRRNVVVTALRG